MNYNSGNFCVERIYKINLRSNSVFFPDNLEALQQKQYIESINRSI